MDIVEVHLFILIFAAVGIVISDYYGTMYMRGSIPVLPRRRMRLLHAWVWLGLLGMIGTGLYMALPGLSFYLGRPEFVAKMIFVLALVLNAFFIGSLMRVSLEVPYAELPPQKKRAMQISGAISTIGWLCAAGIGLFLL